MEVSLNHSRTNLIIASQSIVKRTLNTLKQTLDETQSRKKSNKILLNCLAELEQASEQINVVLLSSKLTPILGTLLRLLIIRERVIWETAYAVIYQNRDKPHSSRNVLQTHLYLLRKILKPYDIVIITDTNEGCHMTFEMRKKAKALLHG